MTRIYSGGQIERRKTSTAKKTVDGIIKNSENDYNETNFKNAVSMFDELDRIVRVTPRELDKAIAWFRKNGYDTWLLPDGVAFMKPSYLDPYGSSSPQFHRIRGEVFDARKGGGIASIKTKSHMVHLWTAGRETKPDLLEAFEWYEQTLAKEGRQRQAEAEELQEALAEQLL